MKANYKGACSQENGRAAPDLTASPGRAPAGPPQPARANHAPPCVSGVSNEIFRQIELVENDHDATTAAALELVEIVKRPGQTLGLYIREGDGGARTDGVFISRIALESAVYNSGCLKVGDEILAVNLVDVRRMSLDDVVIIMSIPRRLLLCTRQRKGKSGPGSPSMPRTEHKPPPVVVLKRDCRDDDDRDRVDGMYSHTRFGGRVPRSGSEQQLPRAETHSDFGRHSLLRSSLKASAATGAPGGYGTTGLGLSSYGSKFGTARRNRSLDYSSDTEATAPSRTPYYSGLSGLGLSRRAGSVLQDEPEPLSSRLDLRSSRGRLTSSPSVFTSDEYRAWLSRAPSTSALYESLRPRLPTHYSAENIHDALKNMETGSRFGSTLGLANRRIERPRHLPARSLSSQQLDFLKYKIDKPGAGGLSSSMTGLSRIAGGVSGMLWVHLLAGRGLRPSPSGSSPGSPPSGPLAPPQPPVAPRDLYCVLECDRVRTGELQFDWDESFELELVENRQLDVLVYSWDPQHRHKLCYRGAVTLPHLLARSPDHQLAIRMEPRGTLYVRIRHTEPHDLFRRRPAPPRLSPPPLFGAELEQVVSREVRPTHAPPVPLIIRRCVEEIERRGLDIIGLYRLCGSAAKKRILREAFERNARGVELTPDSVPDINVITGVLKDYLRELPQPLFSRCLFQMTLDALVECLPRAARATLVFLLDHLALVVAAQDRNKMSPQHLAVALAPPLMLQSQPPSDLDYQKPIHVLQCLLQIWPPPKRSVAAASAASPPPALLARPAVDRSPPARVLSSVRGGQYRPRSPQRGPLPAPPRPRQVTLSSPGSPTSSSGSHSPADTIKHTGSVSSILRQPDRASPRPSPKHSPRNSPRATPTGIKLNGRDLTPRESPRDTRESPRSAIPGTSAGLAVTLNSNGTSPRYSSTNPFLQQYDAEEEAEAWRAADIFSSTHA
ncbi:unnamed protein product [Leptidea sinapis]|uniref:Rho-GAP domain-containing protein n=1 Tax=Leptidea sinapis TaxID=189913 RepID=A0A5E4Q8A4_9NEOP|nr:unnamed protein product [Leptidea sinapis]